MKGKGCLYTYSCRKNGERNESGTRNRTLQPDKAWVMVKKYNHKGNVRVTDNGNSLAIGPFAFTENRLALRDSSWSRCWHPECVK